MPKPYLSVIIPAYNEENRIATTLLDIDKYLSQAEYDYEIIAVSDGSKDNTADIVKKLYPAVKNLRLMENKENKGKGGVVRQGMLEAKGAIRLFTDADNSTSIEHFEKMRPWFEEGFPIVICSRAIKGAVKKPPQPFYKNIMGQMGNLFIQAVVLPGFWDTQCGFKAFTEEAATRIFSLTKIDRWGFDVEILALAKKMGYKIKEIPAHWVNNQHSHVKFSGYLQVLWETVKIRWWLINGSYEI